MATVNNHSSLEWLVTQKESNFLLALSASLNNKHDRHLHEKAAPFSLLHREPRQRSKARCISVCLLHKKAWMIQSGITIHIPKCRVFMAMNSKQFTAHLASSTLCKAHEEELLIWFQWSFYSFKQKKEYHLCIILSGYELQANQYYFINHNFRIVTRVITHFCPKQGSKWIIFHLNIKGKTNQSRSNWHACQCTAETALLRRRRTTFLFPLAIAGQALWKKRTALLKNNTPFTCCSSPLWSREPNAPFTSPNVELTSSGIQIRDHMGDKTKPIINGLFLWD